MPVLGRKERKRHNTTLRFRLRQKHMMLKCFHSARGRRLRPEAWGLRDCSKKAPSHPWEKFSLFFHTHFWMYIHFPYYSYGFIPNHFKLVIQVLIRYLHLFHDPSCMSYLSFHSTYLNSKGFACSKLPFKQPLTLRGEQIRSWQSVTKFFLFFQAPATWYWYAAVL